MKLVIVGAGMGGLSAAICFARQGHKVLILERSNQITEQGGGIAIRPGATRIMCKWGLEEDFDRIGDRTGTVLMRRLDTGELNANNIPVDQSDFPEWGTTRAETIRLLHRKAIEEGAELRLGTKVVDIREDDYAAHLSLDDGTTITADIVLAADGIRSALRPKILSDLPASSIAPILSDITFYGFDLSVKSTDPAELARHRLTENVKINAWTGLDRFLISRYNTKLKKAFLLFGVRGQTDQQSLWDTKGDINYLHDCFEGEACGEIIDAIKRAKSCERWRLAEMPDLPRWSSKRGRLILLGDSAHGMHPNAAQGFSQIIEDIGALEHLFGLYQRANQPLGEDSHSIQCVVRLWESVRIPRVNRIKAWAKWNTEMFSRRPKQSAAGPAQKKERSIKAVSPNMNADFKTFEFLKFANDYDVIGELDRALHSRPQARL